MSFESKRVKLLAEIRKAEKEKKVFKERARLKDLEINKKIAQREELDQLKFNLSRLKKKPKNKTELLLNEKRIRQAKSVAKSLGKGFLKGAGVFVEALHAIGSGETKQETLARFEREAKARKRKKSTRGKK